jgi:thiol-disulfide isomerase/thioredoxin
MHHIEMKRRFLSFGAGLVILGGVFSLVAFVSNDARLSYAMGAILIFGGAVWLGAKTKGDWWSAILLCAPLVTAFAFTALRELPFLWPNLLLWVLGAAIGVRLLVPERPGRALVICGAGLLFLTSLWYCSSYVPKQMGHAMNHMRDNPGPIFTLQPVSDGAVPLHATPGKILLIDFFQTWCLPCIAELPQLAGVREDLQDRQDIQFVVVATDAGGDTPQRFRSLAEGRHIRLPLAFDAAGKAHTAFGMTGFPAVVVLDRNGRVRFTHEGYNSSEINFRRDLAQLLKTL